jgi:predicted O-methyltransferase YrrM
VTLITALDPTTSGCDDTVIGQLTTALFTGPALLVAHEIGLFAALEHESRSSREVAAALSLRQRAADALLLTGVAAGLVERRAEHYSLTNVGRTYLVRSAPTSWCGYLDYLAANPQLVSYTDVRTALLNDAPRLPDRQELFEIHRQDSERAERFTRWMHSVAVGPARAWPGAVDLSRARHLLDVAGGSGAHAIAAARRWPQLQVTLLDLPNVCCLAEEYISEAALSERVVCQPADMWRDNYPECDVHFYSQIFHDWSRDECRELARKSWASLPPGGLVIVHEVLYDDDKRGPLRAASVNVLMSLLYARGQQYSGAELGDFLSQAGFVDVDWQRTWGYWGIVVGRKPSRVTP